MKKRIVAWVLIIAFLFLIVDIIVGFYREIFVPVYFAVIGIFFYLNSTKRWIFADDSEDVPAAKAEDKTEEKSE